MYPSAYDFKAFYNSRTGRVVRRVLRARMQEVWPDTKGLRVMGCGYALPFLRMYEKEAERIFAMLPPAQGVHQWPQDSSNLVALGDMAELPVENSSVDRIILAHSLEFSEHLRPQLAEIWRVLKPNGRVLIMVPNRAGFWARADWSPFGQGTPYSLAQLCFYLRDNQFIHEQTEGALFLPAVKSSLFLKSAGLFERVGRSVAPVAAGVHMVEASKQLYASVNKGSGVRARSRERGILAPKPAAFSRNH